MITYRVIICLFHQIIPKNMLFSITIPAYKRAYLKECIDSILSQTYKDFELVIVNDSSPEDLDSIINTYADPRIHYYVNEKNCGAINVVDNWNKCLEYAKGDYIMCMGDDDKLLPNCLEEYAQLIYKHPGLGVYHAWTEIIDENSNFVEMTAARCEYESAYSLLWHRWDNRRLQFIGDFLFDTKQLRQNGGFFKLPLAWASDDITAIIAALPKGVANTQKLCFCYRRNSQTISYTGNILTKMLSIKEEEDWYNSFLRIKPQSETDRKFWLNIKQKTNDYFEIKRARTISKDLKRNFGKLLFWMWHRQYYRINHKTLIRAVAYAMK